MLCQTLQTTSGSKERLLLFSPVLFVMKVCYYILMWNVCCCHRKDIPFPRSLKLQFGPGLYDQGWTLARFVFVIRLTGSQQQLHTQ